MLEDNVAAAAALHARTPRHLTLEDGELLWEGEDLRLELETRPNGGPESSEQSHQQR